MGAVWLVAASHLRRNRRSSVLITLLLAVVVAVVLAALAGARRTEAAVSSFVAADRGADGYAAFTPTAFGGTATADLAAEEAQVEAVAGVERTARFSDAFVELSGPTIPDHRLAVQGYVGMEPDGLGTVSTFHLVAGRHQDQSRADEVLIDEELARDVDLGLGAHVSLRAYTLEQLLAGAELPAAGTEVDAEVVGIVRRPTDLRDPQDREFRPNDYVVHHDLYLTAAFWEASGGEIAAFNPMVGFDLEDRSRTDEVLAAILDQTGAYTLDQQRFLEIDGTFRGVDRSAGLHARGLQAFAAALAVAGLFLVGQTLGRQIVVEAHDDATLRAIGMTRRRLRLAAVLRAAPVALAGAALGALGAIALSPLAPLPGTVARRAELHPGLSVDAVVLVGGALLAAILAMLASALPSARVLASGARPGARPDRLGVASWLAAHGLPAPAVVGVRFALEPGRGRTAVPVRTAIAAAAAAVALVVAAVVFSSSLAESRGDPRRYGVTWDVAAGGLTAPEQAAALAEEVRDIPGVVGFAAMGTTALDASFGEIPVVMLRQEQGVVNPLITEGRAPGPGEVALGAQTLEEQGLHLGDQLLIDDPIAGSRSFEITGTVVLNVAGVDVSISPGRGALFDWSVLGLLDPQAAAFIAPRIFLVDAEPGRVTEVEDRLATLFPTSTRAAPVEPLDLTNLGDASLLPAALGAVVALLGLGTVAHALLSAVRRRERELAVLRTIGFVRAQVRRAVSWQALTFGAVALAVGVPIGVAGGRVAWSIAAGELGIPSHPVAPSASIAVVGLAFLLLLVLTAVVPAQLASRVGAATALRRD